MLDAHQLNVFLVAAETLNFTQTAKRLHMTQPSVSQHIQALEKHFGTELFLRRGRHLELSDSGAALVPLSRNLVASSIQIEEMMDSLSGEVYGHLIVGCSTTPGKYVLPKLLAQFHAHHPKVRVTCQVTSQKDAVEMLCQGDVHIALTSSSKQSCLSAEFQFFMCDPIVLIAPKEHPWAKRGQIEAKELYQENFVMRESGSGTYIAVEDALNQEGINLHKFNTLLTLGNSEAIALAVQEGLGVGFVSELVVKKLCAEKVAVVQMQGLNICRDIFIGCQNKLPASAAQNAFWNFIQENGFELGVEPEQEKLIRIPA